jgi:ABC-type glycerol-3-phosphate transport system permease component
VKKFLLYLFILFLIVVWIFPVFWLVVTSLKLEQDVVTRTLTIFNKPPTIQNYIDAMASTRIANWMFNSIVVSLATMVFTVFVDATIAYALARIRFRGRKVIFWVVLAGMMVPFQVLVIPLYLHFNTLGLINTLTAMILPRLALPIGVFILKQFFEGIPHELEEAAVIDGAGRFVQFWSIIIPLGKAALVTVLILSFIQAWNDFLWPLIVASETIKYTITVGIANFQGVYGTEYSLIMAGAVIASLPQIIAFLVFREHIVKGIAMTGLKG